MSQGHGAIQRFILDYLDHLRPGDPAMPPITFLAAHYAHATETKRTAHLHASFRRAAYRLDEEGLIALWLPALPTLWDEESRPHNWRRMLCVSAPDMEHPAEEDFQLAYTALYLTDTSPTV